MQERNTIHRDIKPENILLMSNDYNIYSGEQEEFWHVKLCDFGWSTHSINQDRETFCGTPDYLAPELLTDKAYDNMIDNWAVGILTYELLTGASPFAGPSKESQNQTGGHRQSDIYRNIKNVDLCYNNNYENLVSPLAKNFIDAIL